MDPDLGMVLGMLGAGTLLEYLAVLLFLDIHYTNLSKAALRGSTRFKRGSRGSKAGLRGSKRFEILWPPK